MRRKDRTSLIEPLTEVFRAANAAGYDVELYIGEDTPENPENPVADGVPVEPLERPARVAASEGMDEAEDEYKALVAPTTKAKSAIDQVKDRTELKEKRKRQLKEFVKSGMGTGWLAKFFIETVKSVAG